MGHSILYWSLSETSLSIRAWRGLLFQRVWWNCASIIVIIGFCTHSRNCLLFSCGSALTPHSFERSIRGHRRVVGMLREWSVVHVSGIRSEEWFLLQNTPHLLPSWIILDLSPAASSRPAALVQDLIRHNMGQPSRQLNMSTTPPFDGRPRQLLSRDSVVFSLKINLISWQKITF